MAEGRDPKVKAISSGQGAAAVNIVLGSEVVRFMSYMLIGVFIICLASVIMTVFAGTYLLSHTDDEVRRAEDKVDEANINLRQSWYWDSQVYAQVTPLLVPLGLHLDPPPMPIRPKSKPKEK